MLDRCSCRRDNPSLPRCSAGGPVCHFSGRFRPCDCTSHVSLPVAHSSLPESLTRLAQLVLRRILETCAHWTRVDRVCMGRTVVAAAPRYVAIAGCLSWLAEQLFGSRSGCSGRDCKFARCYVRTSRSDFRYTPSACSHFVIAGAHIFVNSCTSTKLIEAFAWSCAVSRANFHPFS